MTQLTDLADDFYDFAMAASPIALLWNGKLQRLAEWDDLSPQARAELDARFLEFAEEAEAIETDDEGERALRDVIASTARSEVRGGAWRPELFMLNPRMGAWEMILSFGVSFPLTTAQHGADYIAKLRAMPAMFEQLMDVAEEAADEGRVALARHLRETAASVEAYLATPSGPEERLAQQAPPTELDEATQQAWRADRDEALRTVVRPGLAEFRTRLLTLAERGMPDDKPGLVHLPGGLDVYRDKMWSHLLLEKTPEEVHQLGLDQIAKLEDEYRAIAGPLLGTDDIQEIYRRLREDESLKYTSAEAIITDARAALAKAEAAAPEWFKNLPVSRCSANATDFGAMGYYSAPDPETGKPAAFFVKTSNPSAWSSYELEALTFHEAIPGHHLQIALAAESTDLHKVQREFHNTAYIEGWGLYTERLSDEMGMYSSELSRVGMLSHDSLRAGRLVLDTGIHALGWSREQAIQYMCDHSPIDRAHVEQEVDRYIGMPGQALSYMVGRLEILDIRAEAEKAADFDIRDFHDKVLRHGAVPLTTLRAQVLGS